MESFTSRGVEVRYRCHGDGVPVVLIHGFGQSPGYWSPLWQNHGEGYSYYGLHLKSLFSSKTPLTFTDQVDVLVDWIEQVIPQHHFHLVGASYGGALSWALRLRLEDRILSHTMINPMPLSPMKVFRSRTLRWILSLGYLPGGLGVFLRSPLGSRTLSGMAKIFRLGLKGPAGKIRHFNLRKLVLVEKALSRFFWIVTQEDWSKWQVPSSKEIPSQILYGNKDHLFHGQDYESYIDLMPSALVRPFAGVGHLLLVHEPERSTGYIYDFLKSS